MVEISLKHTKSLVSFVLIVMLIFMLTINCLLNHVMFGKGHTVARGTYHTKALQELKKKLAMHRLLSELKDICEMIN